MEDTRAVTRFVRAKFILLDEGLILLGSGEMAEFVQGGLQRMRKYMMTWFDWVDAQQAASLPSHPWGGLRSP
jgi:hypothetical protein